MLQLNEAERTSPSHALPVPKILLLLLALTLPLVNPWVRGDGVGYYAFARALLIQHNLDFTADYQHGNEGFREARLDAAGIPREEFRTSTGHLDNHFTVGPAMLWAPFLLCAHAGVLAARAAGSQVAADGFSLPYLLAMALGTLCYGFLALCISYRVACRFVEARWALLATVAIWWASSLPVYMYFNPSWSHAHSAFTVALFFWYWLRTREQRSVRQWVVLGLIAGLMLNVYYPNVLVLLVMVPEAIEDYRASLGGGKYQTQGNGSLRQTILRQLLFGLVVVGSLSPTFLTKYAVYGGLFETGYIPIHSWFWKSPWFIALLFSSNHGLFSWTPILAFSVIGIFLFWRKFPRVGLSAVVTLLAFYYFMAAYPDWTGISSYGNRFFVSMTVFFVLGLASLLSSAASAFPRRLSAGVSLGVLLSFFVLWNTGLIFQWGSRLIPARGPVSWRQVAYNQVHVVPYRMASQLRSYLFRRDDTLRRIEQPDIERPIAPASR